MLQPRNTWEDQGMLLSRRHAALGLVAGAAAASPVSQAWGQVLANVPELSPSLTEVDPTKLDTGKDPFSHMLAPVGINGQGPFNFLLDTGANTSCVSRDLADRLMLAPADPTLVHTAVGARTRPSVLIDSLDVGKRSRKRVKAAALPALGPQIDGVLGVDWLNGQRLELDFRKKTLEITRSRSEISSANHVVVPARRRLGQLTIVDADLSGHKISAMIDSGSQATICNTPLRRLVEQIELHHHDTLNGREVHMETIAGEPFKGEMFYLPFLRLGGLTLGNVPTVYADTHIFELWGLKTQPAIVLGMDLLTQFNSVALDYGRSEVRFDLA
jgi:predicted aspartyl protease